MFLFVTHHAFVAVFSLCFQTAIGIPTKALIEAIFVLSNETEQPRRWLQFAGMGRVLFGRANWEYHRTAEFLATTGGRALHSGVSGYLRRLYSRYPGAHRALFFRVLRDAAHAVKACCGCAPEPEEASAAEPAAGRRRPAAPPGAGKRAPAAPAGAAGSKGGGGRALRAMKSIREFVAAVRGDGGDGDRHDEQQKPHLPVRGDGSSNSSVGGKYRPAVIAGSGQQKQMRARKKKADLTAAQLQAAAAPPPAAAAAAAQANPAAGSSGSGVAASPPRTKVASDSSQGDGANAEKRVRVVKKLIVKKKKTQSGTGGGGGSGGAAGPVVESTVGSPSRLSAPPEADEGDAEPVLAADQVSVTVQEESPPSSDNLKAAAMGDDEHYAGAGLARRTMLRFAAFRILNRAPGAAGDEKEPRGSTSASEAPKTRAARRKRDTAADWEAALLLEREMREGRSREVEDIQENFLHQTHEARLQHVSQFVAVACIYAMWAILAWCARPPPRGDRAEPQSAACCSSRICWCCWQKRFFAC